MKVYISGPITGAEDYEEKFARAEAYLRQQGYEPMNPVKIINMPEGTAWEEYIQLDIAILGMCQKIFMLHGWKNSRGAKIEFDFACDNLIPILFEKPEMYQDAVSNKIDTSKIPQAQVNTQCKPDSASTQCGGVLTVEIVKEKYTDAEEATIEKAAAELGVNKSTLYRFVSDNGLRKKKNASTPR